MKSVKRTVSIVMPMRNAATTVLKSLASLEKQTYQIKEVIVVDDGSTDNSNEVVQKYSKKSKLLIRIITREKNVGIGSSLNLGVKNAKGFYIVLMHSDCFLPTSQELYKLMMPFENDKNILGSYPTIELSVKVWNTYDFWEKCFFERNAGKPSSGATTKFDCIERKAYLKVGGFDTVNFSIGGEDMDFSLKIRELGKFVPSEARVSHLHYLGHGYSFRTFLRKKRQYAMIYGRLLKKRPHIFLGEGIILLHKPFLAILFFLLSFNLLGITLICLYSIISTKRMFMTKSTLNNWRILFLPLVNILLVYYESFWIFESYFFGENKIL